MNRFLVLFLLLLAAFPASSQNSKQPFAIRISCGARENVRTTPTNALWLKDFAYTGGIPGNATTTSYIVPPLKTLRYFPLSIGPENCYNINSIPNGHYSVRIFFALLKEPNLDSEPLFDVSVEGTQIYSLVSGWSTDDEQPFAEALVFVTDNSVSACFHSTGHGDPSILSIEILQVDDNAYYFGPQWGRERTILRTVKRLTCGTGKSAFGEDYNTNHWGGDRFWAAIKSFGQSSDQAISTENNIKLAAVSPNFYPEKLYQSAIVGTDSQPDLSYSLDVDPNKNYSIWLHFAEFDPRIPGAGKRVFDILINGDIAFKDIDIIHMTGDHFAALVLNKTVAVNGRTLTITIHPSKGNAIINGIEVFEVIPTEFKTSAEEVRALQTLKNTLGLPLRLGWNGDPCVPQQHPWSGVDCQFDKNNSTWVIDGLGLDNQGLRGFLPTDISRLRHLQNINLSGNSIRGAIPSSIGSITGLATLDLSYNLLNGSIPESLGELTSLRILDLNGNFLSGIVPAKLGGIPLHGASFNFSGNAGLCGIPGLPICGPHLSTAAKVGIAIGVLIAFFLIILCSVCWWKRRQNILRAQKLATREAPYAKARTHFVHNVQMTRPQGHDNSRTPAESGSRLLPSN